MTKKKKYPSMTGLGVNLIGSTVAIGSIPNISGSATETSIKQNAIQGYGNIGSALPTMGKMQGTGMVIKSIGRLKKKSKGIIGGSL